MQPIFGLLVIASVVSAHSRFVQLNDNALYSGVRTAPNDGPVTDVTLNDITCNVAGSMTSADVIEVTAGSSITATWVHGGEGVIASSHKGPVMAYMKKVTDATTDTGVGDGWFKVSEDGLDAPTEKWGVDNLIAAGGKQVIPIPSCIENGQYLVRAEIIALHGAGSANGAQFYMSCAQINVSGGTAPKAPATVAFPGAYSGTDPGILIEIWYPKLTSYTIPGPSVFTCDGSASGTTSPVVSPVTSSAASNAPVALAVVAAPPTTLVTMAKPMSSAPAATPAPANDSSDLAEEAPTPTSSDPSSAKPSSVPTEEEEYAPAKSSAPTTAKPTSVPSGDDEYEAPGASSPAKSSAPATATPTSVPSGEDDTEEPAAAVPAAQPTGSTGSGTGSVLYGQCGGKIWTGATTCQVGTCKVQNEYYSQCVNE